MSVEMTSANAKRAEAYFWERVEQGSPEACWPWTMARHASGYGRVRLPGVGVSPAHRVAYLLDVGDIPTGYAIDHLCGNPPCCNPRHLEPVTPAENNRRAAQRQRARGGNGHIEVRERASGVRYRVRFREHGRNRAVTFTSLGEAEAFLAQPKGA